MQSLIGVGGVIRKVAKSLSWGDRIWGREGLHYSSLKSSGSTQRVGFQEVFKWKETHGLAQWEGGFSRHPVLSWGPAQRLDQVTPGSRRVSWTVLSWPGHGFNSSFRQGEKSCFSSDGDAEDVFWKLEAILNHWRENGWRSNIIKKALRI